MIVVVDAAGDVIVSEFAADTEWTEMNLIVVQVGQSLVVVIVFGSGFVVVAGVLDSVVVVLDPVIVI